MLNRLRHARPGVVAASNESEYSGPLRPFPYNESSLGFSFVLFFRFLSDAGRNALGPVEEPAKRTFLPRALPVFIYFTMKFAVVLFINEPETPVKVMV